MKLGFDSSKKNQILVFIIILFLLLIALLSLLLTPYINQLSDQAVHGELQDWAAEQGWKGLFIMFFIQVAQVVIAFIPGEPIEIMAGLLYGPWLGLLICLLGCVTASTFIFFLVRKVGRKLIVSVFGDAELKKFDFLNQARKIEMITFILFLIPGTPKDLLTYVAGISKIKPANFLIISTFARIPSVLSSTFIGSTMGEGNWSFTIIIFAITAAAGLIGIWNKERILSYCQKISSTIKKH